MKGGSAALKGKRRRGVHHQPQEARRTVNIINLAAAQLRMLCGFQGHLATQTAGRSEISISVWLAQIRTRGGKSVGKGCKHSSQMRVETKETQI